MKTRPTFQTPAYYGKGNMFFIGHIISWFQVTVTEEATVASRTYNKQLLDEVEYDIMNYRNRGLYYLPKPKAEADNTDTRF